MALGLLDIHMQKSEVEPPLHTACTRINSKCTTGLDVISKTIKQLKESIEAKKLFLRYDPKISGEKEKHR